MEKISKTLVKSVPDVIFFCMGLVNTFFMTLFIWNALFNNGITVLDFNSYGEMYVEIIILTAYFLFSLVYTVKMINSRLEKRIDGEKNDNL